MPLLCYKLTVLNFASLALFTTCVLCTASSIAADKQTAKTDKPNIVLIVADDLGYSDIGCYGGEIATPNLDQLAAEGVRLTKFCNGGMCVISRLSLFTGRWWTAAQRDFGPTETLPEQLQKHGYRTALIGKWHLQGHPMDHGFDHFFGFLNGFADHFLGSPQYRLDRKPFSHFGPDYYSSDALTDRAIRFIKDSKTDNPFMVTLSYQAPHNPLQATPEMIAKYRGKYQKGWQAVREARFKRQQELGIVTKDETLPTYPKNLPQWDSLTDSQRDLEDLRMSVYAAMVDRMDQGIGRMLKTLDEKGVTDNTIVLFMSDNGTDSFSVVDDAMLAKGKLPGDPASNWQPGTGWAYASVTPWRLYKISQHSGGITSGAIMRWPAKTDQTGIIRTQPVHMVDVLPTMLQAVTGESPGIVGFAGQSFLDVLNQEDWQRQKALFFQYMDNRAIRNRDWTLAEVDGSGWELFNSQNDRLETQDVSAAHPEVVQKLSKVWLDWWTQTSGNKDYQPTSTKTGPHYAPQGDRGSGRMYVPSAMSGLKPAKSGN